MIGGGEKYRRVEVQYDERGTDVEALDAALASLNGRFDPDDFHVVRPGASPPLEVWLRQVCVDELAEAAAELATAYPAAPAIRAIPDAVLAVRSYGVHGRKRLFVGYDDERKVVGRKDKERRRGKHFYANDHAFSEERRALPAEFEDAVVHGDSEAVLARLPDNCVDLIFTSPPYNFGLDYAGDADTRDWESYFAKLFRVFDECVRVLAFGGRVVVNVQPLFSDCIPSHHLVSRHFMRRRMIWKGEILWEKNNYNCKYTAWGSWKSPASPYLKYTWEFLEVFCKGSLRKPGAPEDADIDAESFKKWVVAKWAIAPEREMRKHGHPAMFPVELARRVLLLFSFRGDVVLDPFAGVGTTCVAARRTGRRYVGVDVSREYCDRAERRLAAIPGLLL